MRKIISSMKKHKGILIGVAIALVFVVSLVGTMGGSDDGYYYNDTMGYGSTSGFNSSISNVMMDAETSDGKDQQENMQLGENVGNKFEDEELEDSVIESCPVSPEEDVEQEICTEDTETEDSEMEE